MNSKLNSYSLTADSRRWWWPSATASAVGTAAIGAILILPTTGYAMPVDYTGTSPATGLDSYTVVESGVGAGRPCFMTRARWNTALDYAQPVCDRAATPAPPERSGVIRPWLDY